LDYEVQEKQEEEKQEEEKEAGARWISWLLALSTKGSWKDRK
jgi:hypothetical protein